MKIDPPLVVQVPLTSELSGRLGEIIAERIADVAPKQRPDIARRTIIEILMTRQDVPLTGLVRRHVAGELERLWIPKRELAKINRQRRLIFIESTILLAKSMRKNKGWTKVGKPKPKLTALEATAEYFETSPEALQQFIKRERRVKKKPRP